MEWLTPVVTIIVALITTFGTTIGTAYLFHLKLRGEFETQTKKTSAETVEKLRQDERDLREQFRRDLYNEVDRLRLRVSEAEKGLIACEMDKLDLNRRIGMNELKIAQLEYRNAAGAA